jgi:hypothetical protein
MMNSRERRLSLSVRLRSPGMDVCGPSLTGNSAQLYVRPDRSRAFSASFGPCGHEYIHVEI